MESGGYFTVNGYNFVAGIQSEAFKQTYETVSNSDEDRQEVMDILSGNTR